MFPFIKSQVRGYGWWQLLKCAKQESRLVCRRDQSRTPCFLYFKLSVILPRWSLQGSRWHFMQINVTHLELPVITCPNNQLMYPGDLDKLLRGVIFKQDNLRCKYCKLVRITNHLYQIWPQMKGSVLEEISDQFRSFGPLKTIISLCEFSYWYHCEKSEQNFRLDYNYEEHVEVRTTL